MEYKSISFNFISLIQDKNVLAVFIHLSLTHTICYILLTQLLFYQYQQLNNLFGRVKTEHQLWQLPFQVGVPDMQQQRKIHGDDVNSVLYVSFLSVSFHLNSTHFQNSQLVVTCTGIFKTLYRKTATIQLGVSSEPVPERGIYT